ncbi:MAG: hypothetical protein ACRDOM_10330, partial [Nocardioides sp.]
MLAVIAGTLTPLAASVPIAPAGAAPLSSATATAPSVAGIATLGLNIELSRLGGGAGNSGSIPPDTMGAVGPDHIVEMINGNLEIFDKTTGASVEDASLNNFWTNRVGVGPFNAGRVFDPRIVYDPASERWFATVIDDDIDADNNGTSETSSNLFVGRSDTSDPTGDWDGLTIDADTVGAEEFHDYETLGLDADGVYSCTQDFQGGGNESCYSLPKADLLQAAPTAANLTRFEATPAGLPATSGSWQPALDFGLSDGRAAILGSTGTALQRTDIFGAAGAGATLGTSVPIAGDPGHAGPPAARQPDDTDAGDAAETIENVAPRFVGNVVERGNSLWAAHAVQGSGANSAIRWYQINESTNTVQQTGLVDDPNRDFHEPSITVNAHGDVVIGYTCSGPTLSPSVCVSLGQTAGGVTTFQAPEILATGNGYYYRDSCTPPGCNERNRWGDYSATVVDPVDPCSFWTFQEYVAVGGTGDVGPGEAESGAWGTRVSKITFDDCVADTASSADLSVFKECKPDVAMPAGQTGTCTILVENHGPSPAEAVSVVDRHVSNGTFTFGTVTTTVGTCAATPNPQVQQGEVTCALGTLGAGDSVVIEVPVSATEAQDINDVVTVSSTTTDPDRSNNRATDGIQVVAAADLSIAKSGDANAVAGTQFTYTVGVDNLGPSQATGVVVTDELPEGVSFVSAVPDVGSFTVNGRTIRWNLGTVAPSAPVREIEITARISPRSTGQVVNTAVVESAVLDPDTANNRVSFTTTVGTEAGLTIEKTDSPDPVLAGDELVYTVTVGNGGPSTAVDVVLTDTLPAGTTLVSAVDGTGSVACSTSGAGVVSCELGDLDPGQSVTVFITVLVDPSVPAGTVLTNQAEASSPTDPDGAAVSAETLVDAAAEIWLEKTGIQPTGNPSGALHYRITVHNEPGFAADDTPTSGQGGPSDAQDVVVVDTLPLTSKKLLVQHLSPSCTYDQAAHAVTCSRNTLPAGTAVVFDIEVQIRGSVGSITNTATVTSASDPVSDNNTDTVAN